MILTEYNEELHARTLVEEGRREEREKNARSIRQLLLDGAVDYTIPQDFIQQGRAPILLLKDLLRKGKLPDPARYAQRIGILCRENL